jgi:hypothetical protein
MTGLLEDEATEERAKKLFYGLASGRPFFHTLTNTEEANDWNSSCHLTHEEVVFLHGVLKLIAQQEDFLDSLELYVKDSLNDLTGYLATIEAAKTMLFCFQS